ncbi:MAG: DNA polymerase III subunit gamma/tau [Solobacterium sp.]|nr:DNA polymerase III subunit gamma/tau [Solobacterium sp.]
MAKTALYQKYRSTDFDEVVGQEYVVRSIKNAVRAGKTGHAYLFCGPRGTGKTTMARLLAKAVNCEDPANAPCGHCENCIAAANGTHPDIVEINAANETHVEDVRELIERSRLAPMQGRHKIYIIDEVHQLSSAASSALLKTLEEPPENVIFVLATTDPQKLLPTIISRCQRFDFSKVRKDLITAHLLHIAEKENITLERTAAEMIAVLSDGGMRDALSIMDQCASYTADCITEEAIDRIYGLTSVSEKIDLIHNILDKDLQKIIEKTRAYEERGIDLPKYTDGMIDILKDCIVYGMTGSQNSMKIISAKEAESIISKAGTSTCMQIVEKLIDTKDRYKNSISASSCFEVILMSVILDLNSEPAVVKTVHEPVRTAPAKEEKTEEIREEPAPQPVIEKIPLESVVSLLVLCSKAEKTSYEAVLQDIKSLKKMEFRKFTSLLIDCDVAASGKDCVILKCRSQAIASRINDPEVNKELYFFIKKQKQTEKMIYAITDSDFSEAAREYVNAMRSNSLPAGMKIEKYKEDEDMEETSLDKVLRLFGSDNVEVIGG